MPSKEVPMQTLHKNWTLHQNVLYQNAHPQPQHYDKGKPKQVHQIVVPEHSTKQYKNTHECDKDDDFMIAFPLRVQPQKNVHNQM